MMYVLALHSVPNKKGNGAIIKVIKNKKNKKTRTKGQRKKGKKEERTMSDSNRQPELKSTTIISGELE